MHNSQQSTRPNTAGQENSPGGVRRNSYTKFAAWRWQSRRLVKEAQLDISCTQSLQASLYAYHSTQTSPVESCIKSSLMDTLSLCHYCCMKSWTGWLRGSFRVLQAVMSGSWSNLPAWYLLLALLHLLWACHFGGSGGSGAEIMNSQFESIAAAC